MHLLLQIEKSRFGELTAKKFLEWSFTNVWNKGTGYRRTWCEVMLSCWFTGLAGPAKKVFGQPIWDESNLNSSEVWAPQVPLNKILHYLKNNQKTPNHIMYGTNTSVFSPSVWYSLNQHVFGVEGKYLCRTVTLQSLRSSLCPMPNLKVGGCHVGESVIPEHRPDS